MVLLAAGMRVMTALRGTLFSSFVGTSFGRMSRKAVGLVIVVVKMKNVMRRKPRSTMGVRSTRVDSFFDFFTPRPFLRPPPEVLSSAISFVLVLDAGVE